MILKSLHPRTVNIPSTPGIFYAVAWKKLFPREGGKTERKEPIRISSEKTLHLSTTVLPYIKNRFLGNASPCMRIGLQFRFALYKTFQKEVLAVKYGVCKLAYPVAQYQHSGRTAQHKIQFYVAMAEDEVVHVGVRLQVFLGIDHQRFLVFAHIGRFPTLLHVLQPAVFGPFLPKVHCPTGMQAGKHPAAHLIAEHGTQQSELPVLVAQSVAVAQIEHLVRQFQRHGLVVDNHAAFALQIVCTPDVVVAHKEVYLHSAVSQLAYLAQSTNAGNTYAGKGDATTTKVQQFFGTIKEFKIYNYGADALEYADK